MSLSIASGLFKGKRLASAPSSITRPTSSLMRDALFNSLQNEIEEAQFLDLFAGSGAMGLEALSRGASRATFVESHRLAISAIKKNITALDAEAQSLLIPQKVEKALESLDKKGKSFDIIFADPPYGKKELFEQVLSFIDQKNILKSEGFFCMEAPLDFETPILNRLEVARLRKYGSSQLIFYTIK